MNEKSKQPRLKFDESRSAYPQPTYTEENGTVRFADECESGGATMRQYYAAKALMGLCMRHDPTRERITPEMMKIITETAFQFADAMLDVDDATFRESS